MGRSEPDVAGDNVLIPGGWFHKPARFKLLEIVAGACWA